jgi:hypothetical protein
MMSHRGQAQHDGCLKGTGNSCLANPETRKPGPSQAVCCIAVFLVRVATTSVWEAGSPVCETRKTGNSEAHGLTAALRLARIARPGTGASQRQVTRTDSAAPLMLVQGADGANPLSTS